MTCAFFPQKPKQRFAVHQPTSRFRSTDIARMALASSLGHCNGACARPKRVPLRDCLWPAASPESVPPSAIFWCVPITFLRLRDLAAPSPLGTGRCSETWTISDEWDA